MFRNLSVLCLLILGSSAFIVDSSEEFYERAGIKVLITSSTGMQFLKENNVDGTKKIIYDCKLGLKGGGTVRVADNIHPDDMSSLIIKNCERITLSSGMYPSGVKEIKVSNVNSLTLDREGNYWDSRNGEWNGQEFLNVSFTDVNILKMEGELFMGFSNGIQKDLILNMENVTIDTLNNNLGGNLGLKKVHLKNVLIQNVRRICDNCQWSSSGAVFIVENSHFENVANSAFVFKGSTFQIINSTLGSLDEAAFTINTTGAFVFSGNHVKHMRNPFYIRSPAVEITDNVFGLTERPWLSQITANGFEGLGVLNVSGNTIKSWPYNFFYMDPKNLPDLILFDNNYFNCTCRYAGLFAYKTDTFIQEVFLNKNRQNFCSNLGNCPLRKVLKNMTNVCAGLFRCPEDSETDENVFQSILSVLRNIDRKFDYLMVRYNSSTVEKPELELSESAVTEGTSNLITADVNLGRLN